MVRLGFDRANTAARQEPARAKRGDPDGDPAAEILGLRHEAEHLLRVPVPSARSPWEHLEERTAAKRTASMLEIVFGTIGLIGLAVALLWLIGLPADEEVEELAGLVTANRDEVETRIDGR